MQAVDREFFKAGAERRRAHQIKLYPEVRPIQCPLDRDLPDVCGTEVDAVLWRGERLHGIRGQACGLDQGPQQDMGIQQQAHRTQRPSKSASTQPSGNGALRFVTNGTRPAGAPGNPRRRSVGTDRNQVNDGLTGPGNDDFPIRLDLAPLSWMSGSWPHGC